MPNEPDLSHLPSGQMAWRALIDQLAEMPDKTERDFIEFKGSDTDLTVKDDQAKVAKFVLGAANRGPAHAAGKLDGNAIMVIGIDDDQIVGIPSFEPMDLQNYVVKFTGNPGPVWDFELLNVANNNRVVVIVVAAPPVAASQPWLCRSQGPVNLEDGLILFRGDGTSRRATSAEVDAMHLRSNEAAKPHVDLFVEVVGMARAYYCDNTGIDKYIADKREWLMDALPKPKPPAPPSSTQGLYPNANIAAMIAGVAAARDFQLAGFGGARPENRTKEQYLVEIDAWKAAVRKQLPKLLDKAAGCIWQGVVVQIKNRTDTYLDEPEFHVHIEGQVEGLRKRDRDEVPEPTKELPGAPRRWGPIPQLSPLLAGHGLNRINMPRISPSQMQRHGIVRFENGVSVNLRFSLESLRPRATWTSDNDDLVLVMREERLTELHGTWLATIKGRDAVYEGELTVPVSPNVDDFSKWLDSSLNPAADNESEDDDGD